MPGILLPGRHVFAQAAHTRTLRRSLLLSYLRLVPSPRLAVNLSPVIQKPVSLGVLPFRIETIGKFDWKEADNAQDQEEKYWNRGADKQPVRRIECTEPCEQGYENHHDRICRNDDRLNILGCPPVTRTNPDPRVSAGKKHLVIPVGKSHSSEKKNTYKLHDEALPSSNAIKADSFSPDVAQALIRQDIIRPAIQSNQPVNERAGGTLRCAPANSRNNLSLWAPRQRREPEAGSTGLACPGSRAQRRVGR